MPIRVLHVLNGLGRGGTEAFIMNVYRAIDREKVQFDFLVRSTENSAHEEEVQALGGRIFITPSFPRHFLQNKKAVKKFFEEHASEYEAVHVHANALMYVEPLKAAKKAGVKKIIMHSHSNQAFNPIYKLLHLINKKRIGKWATYSFACSRSAGEWMFRKDFTVVNNGIRLEKFDFSPTTRDKMRKELGLQDAFVVGHVGRFVVVKNHAFLLDVFKEVKKEKPTAKLLLVGDGALRAQIEESAKEQGLSDDVVFTGNVPNVEDYLQAMDVFVLPSKYEGLGIVLVEAQTSGLPCVVSTNVPDEGFLDGMVEMLSLDEGKIEWSKRVLKDRKVDKREGKVGLFKEKGYSVEATAKFLQEVYLTKE